MIKILSVTVVLAVCLVNIRVKAQSNFDDQQINAVNKPVIDTGVFGKFPTGLVCEVTEDGRYSLSYPTGRFSNSLLTVNKIDSRKIIEKVIIDCKYPPKFSASGSSCFFIQGKDSLCQLNLHNGTRKYISKVQAFTLSGNKKNEWLVYQNTISGSRLHLVNQMSGQEKTILGAGSFEVKSKNDRSTLVYKEISFNRLHVSDLSTQKEEIFDNVESYLWSPNNKVLLIQFINNKLEWLDLESHSGQIVSENIVSEKYVFDNKEKQLAFVNQQANRFSIWYFREGMERAIAVVQKDDLQPQGATTADKLVFNRDGDRLIFNYWVKKPINRDADPTIHSDVIVWNYKDQRLASASVLPDEYWAFVNIENYHVLRIGKENEEIDPDKNFNHYVLLKNYIRPLDFFYNPEHNTAIRLIDLRNGSSKLLVQSNTSKLFLSPKEQFAVWFDVDSLNWFTYETSTGIKRNISKNIPYSVFDEHQIKLGYAKNPNTKITFGLAAWGENDDAFYIYDQYDLWEVDPKGQKAPINVTNAAGRKAKIVLGLVNLNNKEETQVIHRGEELLFSAYDPNSKENGFWKTKLGSSQDPFKGSMQPYAMYMSRNGIIPDYHFIGGKLDASIQKIGRTGKLLISRQSADEFTNYFITQDFKQYRPVTDFQPQSRYNWMTAELINWQITNETSAQGILYKPENFDRAKRYPVIFEYYDRSSDGLYNFLKPEYTGRINIPYFVSNGYLVFVPDIYYGEPGHNAQWATKSIVSAASYLSKLPYVDSTKLGLQGHSHGGLETNYVVTHSQNIFAAACTADGVSDLISAYYLVNRYDNQDRGSDQQWWFEVFGQGSPYGVDITPFTHPEVYMENSPVLFTANVTTPLLIVHGHQDGAVSFSQGLEMFRALTRAGKKVWLLEYLNGGHEVGHEDAKDYTVRLKQFFDHYLKDAPAPKWMTTGRNVTGWKPETGYTLDSTKNNSVKK